MRAFIDVLRFELRLHFRSPLFWGVSFLFFALHMLTLTRTGINLGDNERIALNSPWLIFLTHMALGLFGMVPAIVFAVTAMTRDEERRTSELFFSTPVPRTAFLLGRFSAGTLAAFTIGTLGVLGALAGTVMPWVDPARLAPFDGRPWIAVLTLLVLPNMLVFCALFFSIAALTRSTALTIAAALGVLILDLFINLNSTSGIPGWLTLVDPVGALPIAEAARFWTVSELNTRLPLGLLLPNRLVWLTLALAALLCTLRRYRLEPAAPGASRTWRWRGLGRTRPSAPALLLKGGAPVLRFDATATFRQLLSQLYMDARAVWRSPLFWIVLVLTGMSVHAEATNLRLGMGGIAVYPFTSLLLDFVRISLLQFVLASLIFFSALLVFRERDCGVDGISGALPCPDWVPVVSKTLVLCGVVFALLALSMAVSFAVQEMAGFHDHRVGVFLQGLFYYNGVQLAMWCVLAIIVMTLSPGRWSGMVIMLLVFVVVIALPALRVEHLLLGFRIPAVTYSDLNGFDAFRLQTGVLTVYWGAFCVLLLAVGHLLWPRGSYSNFAERLRDARTRVTVPFASVCVIAGIVFVGAGAAIFRNTNVLNKYVTINLDLTERARYEREYGRFRDLPSPSIVDPDVRVELYASALRLTSRGTAGLRNNKSVPIGEFLVGVDRRNRLESLEVEGATLVASDVERRVYVFRPDTTFVPGTTLQMRWSLVRENRGFPNSTADVELVRNGTYLRSHVPIPGYCIECQIESARDRRRFRLPPPEGLPELGDSGHLDDLWPGINSRSSFNFVIGTDPDQTAVSAGQLRRSWEEDGRRYFQYGLPGPVWPAIVVLSARYEIARADWQGVPIEIYYDAKHPWNVPKMLDTAKQGLEYYSREFGPYTLPYFRMAEYARYRRTVQAGLGTIAYSEGSGFGSDLRDIRLDPVTLHELAHQWFGLVYGARMQGRKVLNEGLAEYSRLMMYRQFEDPVWVRRFVAEIHDQYLAARKGDTLDELPVIRSDDQAYLSYGKASLVMFALQDLIGADKVNGALRAYHARFVDMKPPFPTTLDLLAELRAAAGPEYQELITDLFERITLYDLSITDASTRAVDGGYEVVLDVSGRQLRADGAGTETEVPLDTWFQVAVFPESGREVIELEPLYLQYHRLHSGPQRITLRVAGKPGRVGVDPFRLMIDRQREDNLREVSAQ